MRCAGLPRVAVRLFRIRVRCALPRISAEGIPSPVQGENWREPPSAEVYVAADRTVNMLSCHPVSLFALSGQSGFGGAVPRPLPLHLGQDVLLETEHLVDGVNRRPVRVRGRVEQQCLEQGLAAGALERVDQQPIDAGLRPQQPEDALGERLHAGGLQAARVGTGGNLDDGALGQAGQVAGVL